MREKPPATPRNSVGKLPCSLTVAVVRPYCKLREARRGVYQRAHQRDGPTCSRDIQEIESRACRIAPGQGGTKQGIPVDLPLRTGIHRLAFGIAAKHSFYRIKAFRQSKDHVIAGS